jgi:Cadherin-like
MRNRWILALILAITSLSSSFLFESRLARAATITPVDSTGNVGEFTSIAILNGLPVISYYDRTNGDLKVARCGNAACSGGNTLTAVDSTGDVGYDTSITILNGLPVISYLDFTNGDLKVAACGNATCSSGNVMTTVDSTGFVGSYSSIAILNGLPVISYYDNTNFDLKVARCGNATCSSGNTLTTVDSAGDVGSSTSMEILPSGLPIISYYDNTNFDLKVARCGNATCSSGNVISTVDANPGDAGFFNSMAILPSGLPIISYFDADNGDLKVAACGNDTCSGGNLLSTVDSAGNVGQYTSITILNSLSIISYWDVTNNDLKVARCGNASCSSGNTITTVDSAGNVGELSSIAVLNGLPVISYYDAGNGNLKVYTNQLLTVSQNNLSVVAGSSGNVVGSANLNASDPDDVAANLTYSVVIPPSQGTLSLGATFTQTQINANGLTYSHTGSGNDAFAYTVSDGFWATATRIFVIEVSAPTPGQYDTVGVFRPSTAQFLLRNYLTTGPADVTIGFGSASTLPVVGDWNGDGVDTVGIYDTSNGLFSLKDSNSPSAPISYFAVLGSPGDVPMAGDWDGDGKDGIGVFRPTNGLIYLRQTPSSGFADYTMVLGIPGDMPVTGRWDATMSHEAIGVWRPSNQTFFLSKQICNCGVFADYAFAFGQSGDLPVAGDWDGNYLSAVGVFRPSTGQFLLRNTLSAGSPDYTFNFGANGDKPIAGHWIAGPNVARFPTATPTLRLAPTFQPKR